MVGVAFEAGWAPLDRHRMRRLQAVPTLTVLLGPPGAAEWLWTRRHREGPAVLVKAARRAEVLAQWLGHDSAREWVEGALRSAIAEVEGISEEAITSVIGGRSPAQLEGLATRCAVQKDIPLGWVRRAVGLPCAEPDYEHEPLEVLGKLLALLESPPPLLVRPAATAESLVDVARTLYALTEVAPHAEVALAVDEWSLDVLRSRAPERVSTALWEGLVVLRPQGRSTVTRGVAGLLDSSGVSVPQRGWGAHGSGAARTIEYDPEEFARSQAELLLFEWLERRPHTRGLFRLNRVVEGEDERPMEVDLCCESLKIAIEVDGYHHFRDADAYRRDRRKDLRLQELGYLVVRVLASDVESDPEHVLETIDGVVERRRRRSS